MDRLQTDFWKLLTIFLSVIIGIATQVIGWKDGFPFFRFLAISAAAFAWSASEDSKNELKRQLKDAKEEIEELKKAISDAKSKQ